MLKKISAVPTSLAGPNLVMHLSTRASSKILKPAIAINIEIIEMDRVNLFMLVLRKLFFINFDSDQTVVQHFSHYF